MVIRYSKPKPDPALAGATVLRDPDCFHSGTGKCLDESEAGQRCATFPLCGRDAMLVRNFGAAGVHVTNNPRENQKRSGRPRKAKSAKK
jgi:hypothetical protein